MTKDTIQERLRAVADYNERQLYPENRCDTVDELQEAADRIDALEAENARLREERDEALAKFNHEAWLSEKRALERNHAEADVARLTARIAELEEDNALLLSLATHASTCGHRYGHDCNCGLGSAHAQQRARAARKALEG